MMYRYVGRLDEAERLYDRVIQHDPHGSGGYVAKASVRLLRDGDTLAARSIIRGAATTVDSMSLITAAASSYATWLVVGMLDEPYQRAILTLTADAFGSDTAWYALVKSYVFRAHGDTSTSKAYRDTAQAVAERRLLINPRDPVALNIRTWTLTHEGRGAEAMATLDQVQAALGTAYAPDRHALLARIAVAVGDTARALAELETRNWGADITVPWLCVDHYWDALRSSQRFQRIVRKGCNALN
jgi:hypothetical protein